jgi:hypothetical protein
LYPAVYQQQNKVVLVLEDLMEPMQPIETVLLEVAAELELPLCQVVALLAMAVQAQLELCGAELEHTLQQTLEIIKI